MNEEIDPELLATHLRKPEGEIGMKVAEVLNSTNRYITRFTYKCCQPNSGHQILEIGFGNGVLMPALLKMASDISLVGIDFSKDMVDLGDKLLRSYVDKKEIELIHASVEALPFSDNCFNTICTINTLYFWPDPIENAKEVLRVLKPEGKMCIGIRPKQEIEVLPISQFGFQLYEENEAIELLKSAGFKNVHIQSQQDPPVEFGGEEMNLTSWVVMGVK